MRSPERKTKMDSKKLEQMKEEMDKILADLQMALAKAETRTMTVFTKYDPDGDAQDTMMEVSHQLKSMDEEAETLSMMIGEM